MRNSLPWSHASFFFFRWFAGEASACCQCDVFSLRLAFCWPLFACCRCKPQADSDTSHLCHGVPRRYLLLLRCTVCVVTIRREQKGRQVSVAGYGAFAEVGLHRTMQCCKRLFRPSPMWVQGRGGTLWCDPASNHQRRTLGELLGHHRNLRWGWNLFVPEANYV